MTLINTVRDLMMSLRAGEYTSVGSYPVFWYTNLGGVICYEAMREDLYAIAREVRDGDEDRIVGCEVNWGNPDLYCDVSGARIESAYEEDEADRA